MVVNNFHMFDLYLRIIGMGHRYRIHYINLKNKKKKKVHNNTQFQMQILQILRNAKNVLILGYMCPIFYL